MSEEVWEVWGDSRPTMNTAEQRKVLDYVKKRQESREPWCPYRRIGKRGVKFCSPTGNRCHFDDSYAECDIFTEWWLEKEEGGIEDLLPVGCPF